ncbi:hypothetical protein, partial [Facilibium subflavum]|uniref:hypothetical protein n=1 Tax=Facilibium subflavum TaxID=2219058 RepID=UPI001AADDE76
MRRFEWPGRKSDSRRLFQEHLKQFGIDILQKQVKQNEDNVRISVQGIIAGRIINKVLENPDFDFQGKEDEYKRLQELVSDTNIYSLYQKLVKIAQKKQKIEQLRQDHQKELSHLEAQFKYKALALISAQEGDLETLKTEVTKLSNVIQQDTFPSQLYSLVNDPLDKL